MSKYICTVCNYEYDPDQGDPSNGIAPGTSFEDLPDDWACPLCGLGKDVFSEDSATSEEQSGDEISTDLES